MLNLPLITIITVTLNNVEGLNKTLDSFGWQTYKNTELIVIDGNSIDGTKLLLETVCDKIDQLIIEPDFGIYDAMNKGIKAANGEWLLFMNSGDVFAACDSLSHAASLIQEDVEVIYSDWIYQETEQLVQADIKKLNVRHQAVLYRKHLHAIYGIYIVARGVTISDYLFFLSIANQHWKFCPHPIAICEKAGASSQPTHFYQRIASEIIFGKRSILSACSIFLLYPFYRFIKRNIFRVR